METINEGSEQASEAIEQYGENAEDLNALQPRDMPAANETSQGPAASSANERKSEEDTGGREQASNMSEEKREAIRQSVVRDVEKETGLPTGAIYGHEGRIISVPNEYQEAGEKQQD
jgi:hypothetical protein